MGGVASPFKVQGSNGVIQSKQDNQAPHPTLKVQYFISPFTPIFILDLIALVLTSFTT